MKVTNVTNVEKFFEVVDRCEGQVELVTEEGDRLNLKSKLSQFVSLVKIVTDGRTQQLEILTNNHKDKEELMKFVRTPEIN